MNNILVVIAILRDGRLMDTTSTFRRGSIGLKILVLVRTSPILYLNMETGNIMP